MSILNIQKRMHEIGRIRIGDKGPKGEPRKLTTFRLTSHDQNAIEQAAKLFGGKCIACTGKELKGQFEVITDMCELPIMASPLPVSQYMELWSGGGCKRRCDSETELISGKPCMCERGNEQCKPTTRLPVILPDLPGLGVWRLESKGWNAAAELLQSYEFLKALTLNNQGMVEATLGLEERTSKDDGQTKKFVVPVIRIPHSPRQLIAQQLTAPAGPALPPGSDASALPPAAKTLPEHGAYLKELLSPDELNEFRRLTGEKWKEIALKARDQGIGSKENLFEFAKTETGDEYNPFALDGDEAPSTTD